MRGKRNHEREHALRKQRTEAEHRLWQCLRDRRLGGFKFRRQHRVGPYFADFYCAQARLVVEVDGSQHIEASDYDTRRTCWLEGEGYRVIRVWNDDALARTDDVLAAILSALAAPHPAFGHLVPACGETD